MYLVVGVIDESLGGGDVYNVIGIVDGDGFVVVVEVVVEVY